LIDSRGGRLMLDLDAAEYRDPVPMAADRPGSRHGTGVAKPPVGKLAATKAVRPIPWR
jgi:hypothetical protein